MTQINNIKTLLLCLLACLAALAFGGLFIPGEWYQSLNRAPWNPPNIVFPIVWPILYVLIAIAGWLIFSLPKEHDSDVRVRLKILWIGQLIANALWSWIFFGAHWVLIGLLDLLLIDALVIAIIVASWRQGLKTISYLMMPYLTWLLLATSLNVYILMMN